MVDGKAYAFAFDDVGNYESLVNDGNPAQASHDPGPVQLRDTDGEGTRTGEEDSRHRHVVPLTRVRCHTEPVAGAWWATGHRSSTLRGATS